MKNWTSPMKQAVVAIVSLSLIQATIPQPADSSPRPYHARAGQPSTLPFGPSRIPNGVTAKSATIEVMPELPASSVKLVNGRKSSLAKHLTPPFDDQKPPVSRAARPDSLPKGSGRTNVTALGPNGLSFIENKGQWDERARFQLKTGGKTLWLTNGGIVFDNVRAKGKEPPDPALGLKSPSLSPVHQLPDAYERNVFYEDFVKPQTVSEIEPIDIQAGAYNYLVSSDSSKWHRGVHAFAGVVYRNVWGGVDFKVAKNGANIEQEFMVHPGADLSQVQIAYRGIEGLEVAKDGSLVVHTASGDLLESKPRIYQEIAGKRVSVTGRFKLTSETSYTFEVKSGDPQYALVIDPTLLYSTYLGGGSGDQATGIAVDPAGSAYITGLTSSTDFPTSTGALQTTTGQAFVTKLTALGNSLVYSTYLGNGTRIYAIAVDSTGEAYVAGGNAASDLPTTANALQTACGDSFFLSKLTAQGNALVYSTCLGSGLFGIYGTGVHAVTLDSKGRAYIAGGGGSGLPTTPGAFQSQDAASPANVNVFVAVLDPAQSGASSLIYGSYLGGTNATQCIQGDAAYGIAVDSFGMIYVAGVASAFDFPVTSNAFMRTFPASSQTCTLGGGYNRFTSFAAKFNPAASGAASLLYSTFLGGPGYAWATGVAVDSSGSAYITGYTESSNLFPTTPGSLRSTSNGNGVDAFVTKLNPAGSGLIYSTLLGSPNTANTRGTAIDLDQSGNAYVVGSTDLPDFPTTPDAFQPSHPGVGGFNGFVGKLNASGSALLYSTYLGGGTDDDSVNGIALDSAGGVYVTGTTYSTDFPTQFAFQPQLHTQGGCFDPYHAFCSDAFVAKFTFAAANQLSVAGIAPNHGGNTGAVTTTIAGSGFLAGTAVKLSCPGQSDIPGTNVVPTVAGRFLTATFNLVGTTPGVCNLVATILDGTTATLSQWFTIDSAGAPDVWVDLVGLPGLREGSTPQFYYLVYGNRGNIDSPTVRVWISFDSFLSWSPIPNQNPASQGQLNGRTYLAFDVSPTAGSNGLIPIALTAPNSHQTFLIQAWEEGR